MLAAAAVPFKKLNLGVLRPTASHTGGRRVARRARRRRTTSPSRRPCADGGPSSTFGPGSARPVVTVEQMVRITDVDPLRNTMMEEWKAVLTQQPNVLRLRWIYRQKG